MNQIPVEWVAKTRKKLAGHMTLSEKTLSSALLRRGVEFDTQVPAGPYFIDFHIQPGKIAVEVDGGYHSLEERKAKDQRKERFLHYQGWVVMRFANDEVDTNADRVVSKIVDARNALVEKRNSWKASARK